MRADIITERLLVQVHDVVAAIEAHKGFTEHEKKLLAQKLSVVILGLNSINVLYKRGMAAEDAREYQQEIHTLSTVISKFDYFVNHAKHRTGQRVV